LGFFREGGTSYLGGGNEGGCITEKEGGNIEPERLGGERESTPKNFIRKKGKGCERTQQIQERKGTRNVVWE